MMCIKSYLRRSSREFKSWKTECLYFGSLALSATGFIWLVDVNPYWVIPSFILFLIGFSVLFWGVKKEEKEE